MCHYFTFQQLANQKHSTIYFKIDSQHTIHQIFIWPQRKTLKKNLVWSFAINFPWEIDPEVCRYQYRLLTRDLISEVMMTQTDKIRLHCPATNYMSTLMGNTFHCLLNKGQIPNLALKVLIMWPQFEFPNFHDVPTFQPSRTNSVLYASFIYCLCDFP